MNKFKVENCNKENITLNQILDEKIMIMELKHDIQCIKKKTETNFKKIFVLKGIQL